MSRTCMLLIRASLSSIAAWILCVSTLQAYNTVYEIEPNDTPADFTRVSGAAVLIGELTGDDQDGYRWSVSDVDAQQSWTITFQGVPGRLSVVDFIRLGYADNGVEVVSTDTLATLGSRDGTKPVVIKDLILEPGEYILGVAQGAVTRGLYSPPTANLDLSNLDNNPDQQNTTTEKRLGYRLSLDEGRPVTIRNPGKDPDSMASALQLRVDSPYTAFYVSESTWYRFELSQEHSKNIWEITGRIPVGRKAQVVLRDADGEQLATTTSGRFGRYVFPDLGLEAGIYFIDLKMDTGNNVRSVHLQPTGERVAGTEAEPNDSWQLANHVNILDGINGRMGIAREADFYRFVISKAQAEQQFSVTLETTSTDVITLCLTDDYGKDVQCRQSKDGINLPDLVLSAGPWGLVVRRGSEAAEYRLLMSMGDSIQAGFEAEPNDSVEYASTIPDKSRIKGRFNATDDDFYRLIITGAPQLWRFQVIGDNIHELAYHDASGNAAQVFRASPGQRRVRLDNLYLLPGIHHIRVSGSADGKYTLLAKAIGPPDPNAEMEPNDDSTRMSPLRFGQTRSGILQDKADRDYFRFHLANHDHIRLSIEPAVDGAITANLSWDGETFKQHNSNKAGEPVVLEGLFPPGDYSLSIQALQASEAEYHIRLERLPRFSCSADCEPNDTPGFANPLPTSMAFAGKVNQWRDPDWFLLPMQATERDVTIHITPKRGMEVVDEIFGASYVKWDNQAGAFLGTLPAGIQTYIVIAAWGEPDYQLTVQLEGEPEPIINNTLPGIAGVDLSLELSSNKVAAYFEHGQLIQGNLQLKNTTTESIQLNINSAASNHLWQISVSQSTLSLEAGEELKLPLDINIPQDAWADRPVRVSVRARMDNGAQQETYQDIEVLRQAAVSQAQLYWPLQAKMLGGFNLAAGRFGGQWLDTPAGDRIASGFTELIDDMAVRDEGLGVRSPPKGETREYTLEFAGDSPVEVAGFAVNLMGKKSLLHQLKTLDVSLSLDGQNFTPTLQTTLLPVKTEQSFALEKPQRAKFARIAFHDSLYGRPSASAIHLGEFKVISTPTLDLSNTVGFNLAAAELGGHVVWSRPQISFSNWDSKMLAEDGEFDIRRIASGQRLDWVLGFHHDRAAKIARLEWQDSPAVIANEKITGLMLSISLDSPVGPWLPMGEWDLSENTPFIPAEATWARFIRFSLAAPDKQAKFALADALRVIEMPSTDNYRSILTEWGHANQRAYYEFSNGLKTEAATPATANTSRQTAYELPMDATVAGEVMLERNENWYRLKMPADDNTIVLNLTGDPTVRAVVTAQTESAEGLMVRKLEYTSTPALHQLEINSEPGSNVYLKVTEPPRNVVFLWDTSASIGAYLPLIYNALTNYAKDLVPGRDAANLMPFGGDLLMRDWYGEPYIMQTVFNDYPRKESSSAAEQTLAKATSRLAPRAGTKAIVMITDAATGRDSRVWQEFSEVQPRVFNLGVSSEGAFGSHPVREQDLMQDWSRVNGGYYSYITSQGELEVAYDRAATLLRRPAQYELSASSLFREAPGPGSLTVVSNRQGSAQTGAAVELILDASGSMLKRLNGERRIDIAKQVLSDAVTELIPPGTPVALRIFGHREPNACKTDLEIPLAPLDAAAVSKTLAAIQAKNLAKTPIAASLAMVSSDLKNASGTKVIVLVSDGEETCDGDPQKVIQTLADGGLDMVLNIVGFAIDDAALEARFKDWANQGGGEYYSARDSDGLRKSIAAALRIPYEVIDSSGRSVATGLVNGKPIDLPQGEYRVLVRTAPRQVFNKIVVAGEDAVQLTLQ